VEPAKGKKRVHTVGTPSPKGKGKRRQKSLGLSDNSVEIVPSPSIISEELGFQDYDDQARVAAANDMIAELAWTNTLLEQSVQVAESSTAAIGRFMDEQRVFQALFLTEMRRIFPVEKEVEKGRHTEEGTEEDEEEGSGGDEQMEE
jgi:hypothetical protein